MRDEILDKVRQGAVDVLEALQQYDNNEIDITEATDSLTSASQYIVDNVANFAERHTDEVDWERDLP